MNAYVYNAALLCEECGESARENLKPTDDSDSYPQGPYPDGGGEADSPHCCDSCYLFLENPLTHDGMAYVRECVAERPTSKVVQEWAKFYL